MDFDQIYVFIVLIMTLGLFVWGRWRYDVIATLAMLSLVVVDIIPTNLALRGFGHPAVITVAAVLVISRALRRSGVVDKVAESIMDYTENPTIHIALLTTIVTICSAFMNNVGALALILPIALSTAAKHERSASILLMPLAFGSILGGLITMFGTPPNIIIATYRQEITGVSFGIFDFVPVGASVAIVGVIFISLIGWRLIPRNRQSSVSPEKLFSINEYISEVKVLEGSPLIGKNIGSIEIFSSDEVLPVGLVRGTHKLAKPSRWRILQENDLLILKTDPANLKSILAPNGLEMVSDAPSWEALQSDNVRIAEVLITRDSPLNGRGPLYLRRRSAGAVNILAVARQGQSIVNRLKSMRFKTGDVLLLQGEGDAIDESINNLNLLPLAERELQLGSQRAGLAIAIFAIALLLGALGIITIPVAFIGAIAVYAIMDILPVRDLYKDIDWPVIIFLGAMMSLGKALEATGATELIANSIVSISPMLPPEYVLLIVLVITMTLSDVINNAATALIMAPISLSIADILGVSADPFLMAVAVGASCAFLTPIGHQSNTLVMGPGGYHFGDYWRMGLPLQLLIVLIGLPTILATWPLYT